MRNFLFNSIDLAIRGAESGNREECRSAVSVLYEDFVYFVPFESDGDTWFDTYCINMTFAINVNDAAYECAVYRQTDKLSNVAATYGIGELVAGSTYVGTVGVGPSSVMDTPALSDPVLLLQGSYWIMFAWKQGDAADLCVANSGIGQANIVPWGNQSHMIGRFAVGYTWGVAPQYMATGGTYLQALQPTFQVVGVGTDSFWLGIFDSRDVQV